MSNALIVSCCIAQHKLACCFISPLEYVTVIKESMETCSWRSTGLQEQKKSHTKGVVVATGVLRQVNERTFYTASTEGNLIDTKLSYRYRVLLVQCF